MRASIIICILKKKVISREWKWHLHPAILLNIYYMKPSHHEYSEKVIKFEIIELKTNEDVMKVLIESNYWKKIQLYFLPHT